MIHQKIIQTSEERLGNLAIDAMKMAKSLATSPNGSASYTNSDGTRTVLGAQNITGSTMATHVGDTTPPGVPTGITAWSGDGSVHVSWDGTLTGGIPADFDHVNVLVGGVAFASLNSAGSATCNDVAVGSTVSVTATSEDDVCAIDGTPAHNVSAACTAISVTVTDVADGLSKLIRETEDGVDVGKSADGTTYANGTSVTRQGTDGTFSILKALSGALTTVASFGESVIELGKNSTSAVIYMLGGKFRIAYKKLYSTDTLPTATIASEGDLALSSTTSTILDYHHTVTTAEAADDTTLVPSGTVLQSDVVSGHYDDLGGAYSEIRASSTHGTTTHSALVMLRSGCTTKGGVEAGSTAEIRADKLTYNSGRILGEIVLYNGGAALNYDVAPGEGTTGTVRLSESAANFKELTLYLTDNNGHYAGAFPLAPLPGHASLSVGQTCDVFGFEAADGVHTSTLIRRTRYTLSSATTLVPSNGGYVQLNSVSGITYSADGVNYLKIYRVTGRR